MVQLNVEEQAEARAQARDPGNEAAEPLLINVDHLFLNNRENQNGEEQEDEEEEEEGRIEDMFCVCMCQECSINLRDRVRSHILPNLQCPSCNTRATNFVKVYLPTGNVDGNGWDWQCQICRENSISHLNENCHHLQICETCVQQEQQVNGQNPRCPFCRTPGEMTRVRFMQNNQV
ncbi:hypothetical protein HCN44_004803 [Aphidius gifuensis]|uniref:RING-type domain-containing protein n=1 Tax=Aphidius gifuensis TaxID=684658 RepID=A0A834XJI4_APHGI|nr:hypothetical protein HCN44_004803 [Aphidius gifuensis]